MPAGPAGPPADLLVVDVDGVRTTRWLRPDPELDLPRSPLDVAVSRAGDDSVAVRVTAGGIVRDLCLLAELAVPDAVVDRQLVTLLPGESVTFTVTGPGAGALDAARVTGLLYDDARLRAVTSGG